jgi:hypothetical protein
VRKNEKKNLRRTKQIVKEGEEKRKNKKGRV